MISRTIRGSACFGGHAPRVTKGKKYRGYKAFTNTKAVRVRWKDIGNDDFYTMAEFNGSRKYFMENATDIWINGRKIK